ncbi:response regulator [Spirosoma oryzicola]|uniref:response regulator n=1 Tax=Spirosoma oryzicola TaxID=2898794 RepID=UPI002104EB3C|nr:response regulator [Spirosoma oryzicola]
MYGGRVEAQIEGLGQGSTFTVHLPTLTGAAAPITQLASQATAPAIDRRILVIDDNADAAMTLAMLLKLKGYEAHTRNSGRAGIEVAESLQPSAILLDIGMPGMDGYETCRAIRQQTWWQNVVVIALTGYGQAEDRQRTKEKAIC